MKSMVALLEANLLDAYKHLGRALGATFYSGERLTYFLTGTAIPLCNGVMHAQLAAEEADASIEHIQQVAQAYRVPMLWLLGPSTSPDDLEPRLLAHGWFLDEQVPGMAVNLAGVEALHTAVPQGLTVREVADGEMMATWLHIFCAGFGFPEPLKAAFESLYERHGFVKEHGVVYLLGLCDEEPVGTALLTFGGGTVGIYAVSTLLSVRKQGLGSAMTVAAMRAGRARGYEEATLQATPMGISIYRRLGWRECCTFKTYTFQPQT